MKWVTERFSKADAERLLRHCLDEGSVIQGTHFRTELGHEGLDFVDALGVLRRGAIYDEPEFDIKRGNWKYTIEGHETGGKWLCVVFCFQTLDDAFLITVFSVETKRRR